MRSQLGKKLVNAVQHSMEVLVEVNAMFSRDLERSVAEDAVDTVSVDKNEDFHAAELHLTVKRQEKRLQEMEQLLQEERYRRESRVADIKRRLETKLSGKQARYREKVFSSE